MGIDEGQQSALLVAYYYPPSGSVGARRTVKFARYLQEFNWRPVILSVNEDTFADKDFSYAEQVRHVTTYRTRCPSFNRLARIVRRKRGYEPDFDPPAGPRPRDYRMLVGIKRFLQSLVIPDTEIGWLPFAVYHGLKIIRREKIKLIYASAPPPTTFLVAALLSLFSNRPLVLDLRDSWAIHPDWLYLEENQGILSPIYRARVLFEGMLERLTFKLADAIVLNTETLREVYEANRPDSARRMITITNGYDANDFQLASQSPACPHEDRGDLFSLVFVGSYYGFHSPDYFLKGLHRLLVDKPEVANLLRVSFVGELETTSSRRLIRELGLSELVQIIDRVPHLEAIRWLKNADALLLTLPPVVMAHWWIPAKLFEYLAAEKPIFAVMPEGAAVRLIRDSGRGVVVDPLSPEKISQELYRLCVSPGRSEAKMAGADVEQFEYRALTSKLAGVFERVR